MLNELKLLPRIGPCIIALLDTITDKAVIVFFLFLAFVLTMWSIVGSLLFGTVTINNSTVGLSFLSSVQALFGRSQYEDFIPFDTKISPFTWSIFAISLNLVAFNLFIAVISGVYAECSKSADYKWDLYVSHHSQHKRAFSIISLVLHKVGSRNWTTLLSQNMKDLYRSIFKYSSNRWTSYRLSVHDNTSNP